MMYLTGAESDHNDLPPMAGIRIRLDIVDEDVLVQRIQHAKQSFRAGRQEDFTVIAMRDGSDEDIQQKCLDQVHVEIGKRPLIS